MTALGTLRVVLEKPRLLDDHDVGIWGTRKVYGIDHIVEEFDRAKRIYGHDVIFYVAAVDISNQEIILREAYVPSLDYACAHLRDLAVLDSRVHDAYGRDSWAHILLDRLRTILRQYHLDGVLPLDTQERQEKQEKQETQD